MFKSWIGPGAGVGLLALVLASTVPAFAGQGHATKSATANGIFGRGATVSDEAASPAIINPSSLEEFSSVGNGTTTLFGSTSVCTAVGLHCQAGHLCQCTQGIGTLTDGVGPFFEGSYVFTLNTDISTAHPNGSNACYFGSAILVLSLPNGPGRSITLESAGTSCNSPSGTQGTYNGGFDITGGTANFSNAFGVGVLDFGANAAQINNLFVRGAAGNVL